MQTQNLDKSALEETIIGPAPEPESSVYGGPPVARVELVSGTRPRMEQETQALLRIRLRAAAIVLLLGVGAFFLRGFFIQDAPARFVQAGVSVILAAVIAVLFSKRELTLRQLRAIEAGIFALIAVYLGYYEYALVLMKA